MLFYFCATPKQSKIHTIDPLLMHNALNTNFSIERAHELQCLGAIYESFICTEIFKIFHNTGTIFDSYYWRTKDGSEVDLIIESQGQILPFEIKSSLSLNKRDAFGLLSFLTDHPHVKMGYIIYPGREVQQIYPNITAIPDWWLLGCQT
jgi:predicted AAA+ superfamily ATPase